MPFTLTGIDGLEPSGEPHPAGASAHDEMTIVWSSTAGVTDAFLVLRDVPAGPAQSPEGDVTAVSIDVPSGKAWLVTDNVREPPAPSSATRVVWWRDDRRLWLVSNYGLTAERLTALTLAIQPGSGLPWVLPDPSMTFVGFADSGFYESVRQDWSLDGSTLELTVTNGGLAQQLADVTPLSVNERTIAGASGYAITLPNGQVNLIWPADRSDHWAALLISPGLAGRVDEIAAAIVPA